MFQTDFNIRRIHITVADFGEIQAEHPCSLKVIILNKSTQPVYNLMVKILTLEIEREIPSLSPHQYAEVQFDYIFDKRGKHLPPTISVYTRFPLELFHSWKILRPQDTVLVYPARKGTLILPSVGADGNSEIEAALQTQQKGQNFIGHRPFEQRDSLRQIDWKAYARTQKRNVKLFENEENGVQLLSWQQTPLTQNTEERISQLAQWIGVCQRQKKNYVLKIPGWRSEVVESVKDSEQCLQHLALVTEKELQ